MVRGWLRPFSCQAWTLVNCLRLSAFRLSRNVLSVRKTARTRTRTCNLHTLILYLHYNSSIYFPLFIELRTRLDCSISPAHTHISHVSSLIQLSSFPIPHSLFSCHHHLYSFVKYAKVRSQCLYFIQHLTCLSLCVVPDIDDPYLAKSKDFLA